jgi:hypothetical protein
MEFIEAPREPGSNYFKDQKLGVFFEAAPATTDENVDTSALPSDFWLVMRPVNLRRSCRPERRN